MLTQDYIKSILNYCPESGLITRLRNGKNPCYLKNGYLVLKIKNKEYRAHRIAWLYITGEMPNKHIYHMDMKKTNNAWNNLRLATSSQNTVNRGTQSNNKIGIKNIYKTKYGTFVVRVQIDGKRVRKTFKTIEDAKMRAHELRVKMHGDFVNHGNIPPYSP